MKMLGKNIVLLVGCVGFIFNLTTTSTYSAQTKTKKNSKAENAAIAANKTPVDLNTASEQDLDDLPGIGPALAKKIIAGRPYFSVGELSKVGIPNKTIKKITPMVAVGPAAVRAETKTSAASKRPSSAEAPAADGPSKSADKSATSAPATQAEGGGEGKVWVNTKSGVYHKEGDRWYGKTKQGKYMTEQEAIKAGYRADKEKRANRKD
jgi:hypothetical protein